MMVCRNRTDARRHSLALFAISGLTGRGLGYAGADSTGISRPNCEDPSDSSSRMLAVRCAPCWQQNGGAPDLYALFAVSPLR
jgi:hypothetical protein